MTRGAKYYIISIYFKYILLNILIFIGLIWISQILRILELQHSISNQIFDVIKTTSLVLPSFINPLVPFLLIFGSFFVSYKLNTNNEISILKQYFSLNDISKLLTIIMLGLFFLYLINNEYLSVKMYHKYKVEEIEIRNNLKLGTPSEKEFHIDDKVSIFFINQKQNIFYGIEALIYEDNQIIKSERARIEVSKKNFNLVFYNGERLLLNLSEKSKTNFDKFTYSIQNKDIDKLLLDKEHYNTLGLLKHQNKDFVNHGHNRIYQYLLTILTIFASLKIIFFYGGKKNLLMKFSYIFLYLLFLQIVNSYSIYLMNTEKLLLLNYYIINLILLFISSYFMNKYIR